MTSNYRDYLDTVRLLPQASVSFWEEEICYILDRKRDLHINNIGTSSEYLKDLLLQTKNYSIQERLLHKAIQISVRSFNYGEALDNIEEAFWHERIYTLIELSRKFCNYDSDLIQLLTKFGSTLIGKKLIDKDKLDNNELSILNNLIFLIDEFLPLNVDLNKEIVTGSVKFISVLTFLDWVSKIARVSDNLAVNAMLLFLKTNYPIRNIRGLNTLLDAPFVFKALIKKLPTYPDRVTQVYEIVLGVRLVKEFWRVSKILGVSEQLQLILGEIDVVQHEQNAPTTVQNPELEMAGLAAYQQTTSANMNP